MKPYWCNGTGHSDQEKNISMNRKLIKEFGEDILCYRLRTARHKTRMQYEDFDKQLRRLNREKVSLWNKQRNLGWEPLRPPVQRGWKRIFVLREDVARTNRAGFFAGILEKINTTERSWRKDFKVRKRYRGRKIYVVKPQEVKKLDLREWKKAGFTAAEQMFFQHTVTIDRKGHITQRYVFTQPWRFVLRVLPDMIDQVRIRDAALEQRLQEIENRVNRNGWKSRQQKVVNGGNKWWGCTGRPDLKHSRQNLLKAALQERLTFQEPGCSCGG